MKNLKVHTFSNFNLSTGSFETKMEEFHVRFLKIHSGFRKFDMSTLTEQNLYAQLFLSFENGLFEVSRPKFENPRKIFQNPHQIFKISTISRSL